MASLSAFRPHSRLMCHARAHKSPYAPWEIEMVAEAQVSGPIRGLCGARQSETTSGALGQMGK